MKRFIKTENLTNICFSFILLIVSLYFLISFQTGSCNVKENPGQTHLYKNTYITKSHPLLFNSLLAESKGAEDSEDNYEKEKLNVSSSTSHSPLPFHKLKLFFYSAPYLDQFTRLYLYLQVFRE